jgi:hypothetical protein
MARLEKGFQILTQAVGGLPIAIDGPLEQRPADQPLDGARKAGGVTALQLPARHRLVEERLQPCVHAA